MGRPQDDHDRRMRLPGPTRPHPRVWRMLLSALAGGGLTAVSIGGSLSDQALAATCHASSEHTGTVPLTVTESGRPESGASVGSGTQSSGRTTGPSTAPTAPVASS